jgi:hypothetical protein
VTWTLWRIVPANCCLRAREYKFVLPVNESYKVLAWSMERPLTTN